MKAELTYGDICFIAKKQNHIREKALKKKEIHEQIEQLLEEIWSLEADIECYRYSIRKRLGRE